MLVRNLINNTTTTGGGTLDIGSIGLGVYRPIRLENVSGVTSIRLIYYRGGKSTGVFGTVVPHENSVIDISAMASAVPTIMELTKNLTSGTSVWDYVILNYDERGTKYNMQLRVINASAANAKFATGESTGNLTDYKSGNFNSLDFVLTFLSPLTGRPFNNKIVYGQTANSQSVTFMPIGGGTSTTIPNGSIWNTANPAGVQIVNTSGSIWGYVRYARKYPYCSDRNKRVTLKWLNSYGLYDSMHFDKYRIQPTYTINSSGGNRVTSYEVTVGVVVTEDNERCLYWLSRSPDVQGVFPIATNQWARVTIVNPNAFNAQGGALGRAVNYKCKFEIIEP
nr:MAG TPA: hypothetical protein [Bacteriophage sp.]